MFCIHGSSPGSRQTNCSATRARPDMVSEQPVRVDQLGRLSIDQRHATDLTRPLGVDDVIVDGGEVDDLAESVTDLVAAVVQPEQADLVGAEFARGHASKRQDRFANLDPKLARRLGDGGPATSSMRSTRARRMARRPPSRPRNSSTTVALASRRGRPFGDPRGALLRFQLDAANLGQPRGVEQQDRTAVIGQGGAGIEAGRHDRRSGGLHHQLFVIVNAIDRQRINVAACGPKDHQGAVLLRDRAVDAKDGGKRNLGNAAAADGRNTGTAQIFEHDRFAVSANDLLDGRTRNREMLTGDRHRQRRNDG